MKLSRLWLEANLRLWPLGVLGKKAARLPVVGPLLWNEKNLDSTYIPVGEAVVEEPGSLLPSCIIEELVSAARTESCFLGAAETGPGGPSFAGFCKGCGRCAAVCPRGNIRVAFDPSVDTRGEMLSRIRGRTTIT